MTTSQMMFFGSKATFITATGGTVTTDGDYKVHTFNTGDDFVVTSIGTDTTYGNVVQYLVIAKIKV